MPQADTNPTLGFIVVVVISLTSGFAGVYFEKVLKTSQQVSLWVRNIQLASFSIVLSLIGAYVNDGAVIRERGFFHAYHWLVWSVVAIQAFGGLTVAMVMKYADNILKGFATSVSIIVSCVFAAYFFEVSFSLIFLLGAGLVTVSIYLYSSGAATAAAARPISSQTLLKS